MRCFAVQEVFWNSAVERGRLIEHPHPFGNYGELGFRGLGFLRRFLLAVGEFGALSGLLC